MMRDPGRLAAVAAAALMLAGPALAQTTEEMIGSYRVNVEPEPNSLCPPGQANFDVLNIYGNQIEVVLDGQRTTGVYDPNARSFNAAIPFPDQYNLVRMNGAFARGPDRVNLVVAVEFPPSKPCKALLSGSIPAARNDGPPPPPTAIGPATPSPTGPPIFGVAPQPVPPGAPPLGPGGTAGPAGQSGAQPGKLFGIDIKLLAGAAIVVLLIGTFMSMVRKPPAPPANPET